MNNNFISSYYKYIDENYDLEVNPVHTKTENALKILINEDSLKNFRNNELSYLSGALIYPDKNIGKIWFNRGILRHYLGCLKDLYLHKLKIKKNLKNLNLEFFDKRDCKIGNPINYNFLKFSDNGTNLYNNYCYSLIMKFKKEVCLNSILEIGGGFGKLASLFILKNPELKYSIIELPGTALIAYYFLTEKFKNLKDIDLVYKKDDKISKNLNILCSKYVKNNIEQYFNKRVNTVINVESFQHMNEKDILFYLKLFDENKIKNIISINRHSNNRKGEVKFIDYFFREGFKIINSYETLIPNHFITLFKKK